MRYGVPAIHRGQYPCVQMLVEGGSAHGATNLFCRVHNHPLQGIVEALAAHGELQEALLINVNGVILAHNHPSGNLKPSELDKIMTERIRKALTVMEVNLLDHLIVTRESYFSFIDEGVM